MLALRFFIVVVSLLACCAQEAALVKEKKPKPIRFCPARQCGKLATEKERWDCVNYEHLFAPVKGDVKEEYFVEHDCGGVGWGNSIRGLFNAASLAATTGRRLIVTHPAFNRMFLPPHDDVTAWDFGLGKGKASHPYELRQHWDFEAHGRSPDRFKNWAAQIHKSPSNTSYTKTVLVAGVCGGEREIFTTGGCLSKAMPDFVGCAAAPYSDRYLHDIVLPVPFFTTLFKRPAPFMAEVLSRIRNKLELPALAPGLESSPGAWGLRTPGYYIFALHFRRIPLGFEPLAIDLNLEVNLQFRTRVLQGFWDFAERYSKQAQSIAACRGEKLLIYFATDAPEGLRPEAESRLSRYGRVIFGLSEEEVGHMSPQWQQKDKDMLVKEIKKLATESTQHTTVVEGGDDAAGANQAVDMDGTAVSKSAVEKRTIRKSPVMPISHVDRSDEAAEMHGNMAMVEWWILAHANWLMGHSGTSFSETAAGVGLSPLGVMERVDIVHDVNHASTSYRRDWNGDSCTPVGGATPENAANCPNLYLNNR